MRGGRNGWAKRRGQEVGLELRVAARRARKDKKKLAVHLEKTVSVLVVWGVVAVGFMPVQHPGPGSAVRSSGPGRHADG